MENQISFRKYLNTESHEISTSLNHAQDDELGVQEDELEVQHDGHKPSFRKSLNTESHEICTK